MKKLLSLTCLLSIALIAIGFTRYSINAQESTPEHAEESLQNGELESMSEMDEETMTEDTDSDEMELDAIEDDMPAAENELETLDFDQADESEEPIIDMEELESMLEASEAAELKATTDLEEDNEEDDDEDESDEEENETDDESPSEEDIVEADFDVEQE